MGAASKVLSVILRLGELACAVIIVGLLCWFLDIVVDANAHADARIIYATVIGCMAIALSIILMPPFTYSFSAFPLDFLFFVLFLVAFCLLETLTGINTCDSFWYWSYWGYYWGGFWRTPTIVVNGPFDIDWAGCASWRAVLAFTFILSFAFLMSSFLGVYVVMKYREEKKYHAQNLAAGQPANGHPANGHPANGHPVPETRKENC